MLQFKYPFRKYQQMILAQVESAQGNPQDDHKYHIVAPPGSGKTIVGIELAARFSQPAVIFAPTTTIQGQWRDKVSMFLDNPDQLGEVTSLDPQHLTQFNIYTYQLISTAGESQDHVRSMAIQAWVADLLKEGQVPDEPSAISRIGTIQQNNPSAYKRERDNRYLRIKRDLLRKDDIDITNFLHPNANELIDKLVAHGVRTVILDECHHLLDYWAIVLRHLIHKLQQPIVIGLTATLPDPETDLEYENYTALLGEVDFEVPTPAVVKEGDLAPYRDLVYFTEPTPNEMDYIKNIQSAFEQAIAELTASPKFQEWLVEILVARRQPDGSQRSWVDTLNQDPLLAVAGLRFLRINSYPLPAELLIPIEATQPPELADWAILLERYGLDRLQLSPEREDHALLKRLKQILLPFGFTLTERGLRQSRSPGDLVLTFSESKDHAMVRILAEEAGAMGEKLRAVVVTDFERMSSGVQSRALKNRKKQAGEPNATNNETEGEDAGPEPFPLEQDAGSALRLFSHLVSSPETEALEPILVTGRTLLVDADHGDALINGFNEYLRSRQLQATCRYMPTSSNLIYEVVGEGKDWSSRTYVRMVTDIFEQGLTRCLVGTRGIFGEGWDSLTLNTLIDLTSVTTSTAVQQLRGRTIRLDPAWPRKVAHNWDVVCVAKTFERGDVDLQRFVQRHARYWGIVPLSQGEQRLQDAKTVLNTLAGENLRQPQVNSGAGGQGDFLGGVMAAQIVKGINHVSPELAYELLTRGFKFTDYAKTTRQMLQQVKRRDDTYEMWGIGQDYSNFIYKATRIDTRDLKIRTVFTICETLKSMLRSFLATFLATLGLILWIVLEAVLELFSRGASPGFIFLCGLVMLGGGVAIACVANARQAYRLARKFLFEQPPDAILLDVGRALLAALKDAGLVSRNLLPDYVRVAEAPDNSYQVFVDYASPEDSTIFIDSYQQIFEPVVDQRYLILRDDTRLPNIGLAPIWYLMRGWFQRISGYEPAFHPVPKILASNKERAESFSHYWKRHVGGGKLVFTRSDEGRQVLLAARAQRRPNAKGLAFEIWR